MIEQDLDRRRLIHIRKQAKADLAKAGRARSARLKAMKRQADRLGDALYRNGLVLGMAGLVANPPTAAEDATAQTLWLETLCRWLLQEEPGKAVLDGIVLDPAFPPGSPKINRLTEKLLDVEGSRPGLYWFIEAEALSYLELVKLQAKTAAKLDTAQDDRR